MSDEPKTVRSSEVAENPYVAHMGASIEDLNARIARLAIALGLNLQDEADVLRVTRRRDASPLIQERWVNGRHQDSIGAGTDQDRRVAHAWEELRGLMVLRYDLERQFIEHAGAATVRQVLEGIEDDLVRKGFKPGEDGVDIDSLLHDR